MGTQDKPIRCSFCGTTKEQAHERIIAGPNVFICADCVAVCEHIVKKRWPDYEPPPFDDSKSLDR